MDNQRFDELTRRFAQQRNRRSVLKSIAGGMAAGIGVATLQRSGVLAQTSCEGDVDCADDEICCVGTCRAIECCIDEEDPNARCPDGTTCTEGSCTSFDYGDECSADAECGADEICCVGACRAIECCIDEEDPNARCAEGTTCFEGICQASGVAGGEDESSGTGGTEGTAQLPTTGAGPTQTDSSAQLGALLAAGAAAAAFAGRKLRRSSVDTE